MNKVDSVIKMLNEIDEQIISINFDNLTLAEFHTLPILMRQINELQKHAVAHLENFSNEVRKDCHNIEEAASNK